MRRKLGDVVDYKKGFAFKSSLFQKEGPVGIVKATNFTSDSIDLNSMDYASDETFKEFKANQIVENDIIIQTVGSWPSNPNSVVGKVVRVPFSDKPLLLNQNTVRLRGVEIHQGFLFYLLRSREFKDFIVGKAQGAASQASITLESIFDFEFTVPKTSVQEDISRVLQRYDDLISANNCRIKTLEEVARLLHREWFVDFRFPGHEQVKIIDSGHPDFGMIPEGWKIERFSKAVIINPRLSSNSEQPSKLFSMECLHTNSLVISKSTERRDKNSGSKFQNHDVLFARITPCLENGKTGYVYDLADSEVAIGSTEFVVLREQLLLPELIYCQVRIQNFRDRAKGAMVGASGRQRVSPGFFDECLVLVPNRELQQRFSEIVRPMFELCYLKSDEVDALSDLRDLLLPKLLSGELDLARLEDDSSPQVEDTLETSQPIDYERVRQ